MPLLRCLDKYGAGGPAAVGGDPCQRILEQIMEVLGLVGGFGDFQQQLEAAVLVCQLSGFAGGNGLRLQARRTFLLRWPNEGAS